MGFFSALRRLRRRVEERGEEVSYEAPLLPPCYEAGRFSPPSFVASLVGLAVMLYVMFFHTEKAAFLLPLIMGVVGSLVIILESIDTKLEPQDVGVFINRLMDRVRCWALFHFPGVAVIQVDGGYVCFSKRFKSVSVHIFSAAGLIEKEGKIFLKPLALKTSFSQSYRGDTLKMFYSRLAELGIAELVMWHGEVEVASPSTRNRVLRGAGSGYTLKFRAGLGGVPGCASRAVEAVELLL